MIKHYKYNNKLLQHSRKNKKVQTNAEKLIWFKLRKRQINGYKFRRQYPILNYILDFYCLEKNLAIELDGSQHLRNKLYDNKRSGDLLKIGIKTLRFWDNEVLSDIDSVLEKILFELKLSK